MCLPYFSTKSFIFGQKKTRCNFPEGLTVCAFCKNNYLKCFRPSAMPYTGFDMTEEDICGAQLL